MIKRKKNRLKFNLTLAHAYADQKSQQSLKWTDRSINVFRWMRRLSLQGGPKK